MSLRTLPEAKTFTRPQNFQWDPPSDVLDRWADIPVAAMDEDESVISIFGEIGEDFWSGEGWTAKRVERALSNLGPRDVTVQLNSPGGDVFEGIAIYNILREHKARVSVEVMGMAASAASIIAMAGDEITMGLGSFMMVHNVWGLVIGNQYDLDETKSLFVQFDGALCEIYAARTGNSESDIEQLMKATTWMNASTAVESGFADKASEKLKVTEAEASSKNRGLMARRRMEATMARAGFTRAQRSDIFEDLKLELAGRDAGQPPAARDAGNDVDPAAVLQLIKTIQS